MLADQCQCVFGEHRFGGEGDSFQSVSDIAEAFIAAERRNGVPQGDSLIELSEFFLLKALLQFGLTNQDNLDQFFFCCLEI